MNKIFLGDSFDWAKGRIISVLISYNCLKDLKIDPCFTDKENWNIEEIKTYANLLSVRADQIVPDYKYTGFLDSNKYPQDCDIFLDPDIGISIKNKRDTKHVNIHDVIELIKSNKKRVLLVYQHGWRKSNIDSRVKDIISIIKNMDKGIFISTVKLKGAAIIFLSYSRERILRIFDCFKEIFVVQKIIIDGKEREFLNFF